MALGIVLLGSAATISVATTTLSGGVYTAGTYSPVSDLNRFDRNKNRPVTNIPVLGRSTAYSIPGTREQTITLAGFFSQGDTGQGILITAEGNNDVIAVKYLRDGTNGFTQPVRVGSMRESTSPEGLQEISFDLLSAADPTVLGTG